MEALLTGNIPALGRSANFAAASTARAGGAIAAGALAEASFAWKEGSTNANWLAWVAAGATAATSFSSAGAGADCGAAAVRGLAVKGFDPATRNLFDVAAVPACKGLSHLPIIVDPSHATGRPDLIPPCALAGVAAGADGVHIEVHNCPEEAMSDGPQALLPEQYHELAAQIRALAALLGKTIS